MTDLWASMWQDDLSRGRTAIVFGLALALLGVLVWRRRQRLVPNTTSVDGAGTSAKAWFRRYAVFGMAAAFLGVLSSPDVCGLSMIWCIRTVQVSEFFVLIGLGAPVLAIAIGRDARIGIAEGFLAYALAVLGAVLSCGLWVWMFLDFFHSLLWRFAAIG